MLSEAVASANPGDPSQNKALFGVHVLHAMIHQDRGAPADQVRELEAARALAGDGPESVQILYMLGSTYALLQPPRSAEAIQMLQAFWKRACKGSTARSYKAECETTLALVTKLGGTP